MADRTPWKKLYTVMLRIRRLEEKIAELYPGGEMRCPTHLSIGQEAVAAGVCVALRQSDQVYLSHRCHAGYIAKGGDIKRMMAELYGKKTGSTGGKGGSMHLIDTEASLMGTSALLAGTIPIACGAAFAFKRGFGGRNKVAVCFFGDAAVEEGTFWESVQLAVLWRLPVIFVCENNGLSTTTPLRKRQPPIAIFDRVRACGIAGKKTDGNDVEKVYSAAKQAVTRARSGRGPTFLEFSTYRWLEHVGPHSDWDLGYRSRREVESWKKRCPLLTFEKRLGRRLPPSLKARLETVIKREVDAAVRFARKSPFPDADRWLREITNGT